MIKSFKHRGLREAFETGKSARVRPDLLPRVLATLDAMHRAATLSQLNQPGFNLHALRQFKPLRYSIWVTFQWRITFEWSEGPARVDLEQYH